MKHARNRRRVEREQIGFFSFGFERFVRRRQVQRYHVGGCSSCGFQPSDTLGQVCKDHNILDTNEVVQHILVSHELDQKMQLGPVEVKAWLDGGEEFRFIDVRSPEELALARIPQAGGGFGRLARRFGLAVDNMLSADVVTADGQFRRCSPNENADLFWGIRGGGGNFGIVTSFEFRLHPMQRRVVGGQIMFPFAIARDLLRFYGEHEARDDLTLDLIMVAPPGVPAMVGFGVCYSGPEGAAERALAPVRALGTPIVDGITGMDYVALQKSGDITDPRAATSYLKSGFYPEMSGGMIDALVDGFEPAPNRTTLVFVQQSGGAIGRVPNDATAFSHRDAVGNLLAISEWPFGQDGDEHIASTRRYWANIEPFIRGFYSNDVTPEDTSQMINANYRENFPRLVALKNKYDQKNLFRLNANVEPTV